MASGDFSATELGRIKVRLQDIWPKAGEKYDDNEIAQALLNNQTANFEPIMVGNRCRGAQVNFMKKCSNTLSDCYDADDDDTPRWEDCDWTGEEGESAVANLDVDQCISDTFNVKSSECQSNEFGYADRFAFLLARSLEQIQEELAVRTGVFLNANVMTPATPKYGTLDGKVIEFNPADYNRLSIVSKMVYDARQNDLGTNSVGISTGLMWLAQDLNRRRGGGYGIYTDPTNGIPIYFDRKFNQLEQAIGGEAVILFDPDTVAFWTYNYEQSDNWVDKGHSNMHSMRWRLPDLTYQSGGSAQPIYVDIHRKRVCDGHPSNWMDKFIVMLNFGFAKAPLICAGDKDRIIKFGADESVDPTNEDCCPPVVVNEGN